MYSEDKMAKVIQGTKSLRNLRVIKGQADPRQLRCPSCNELAVQVPNGSGGHVYQCVSCRKRFSMTRL